MPNQYLPGVIAIPSSLNITAITRSFPMVITVEVSNTSNEANTYIVGMAVRLFVPYSYKMFQANNLVGTIIAIDDTDFSLNLDSSQFVPDGNVEQPASISPSGSRNYQYDNNSGKVPFQSLNNIGN